MNQTFVRLLEQRAQHAMLTVALLHVLMSGT